LLLRCRFRCEVDCNSVTGEHVTRQYDALVCQQHSAEAKYRNVDFHYSSSNLRLVSLSSNFPITSLKNCSVIFLCNIEADPDALLDRFLNCEKIRNTAKDFGYEISYFVRKICRRKYSLKIRTVSRKTAEDGMNPPQCTNMLVSLPITVEMKTANFSHPRSCV